MVGNGNVCRCFLSISRHPQSGASIRRIIMLLPARRSQEPHVYTQEVAPEFSDTRNPFDIRLL